MKTFWKGIKEGIRMYFLPITHPIQAWEELKFEWSETKRLWKEFNERA